MSRQEAAGLADQAAEAIRQLNYDVAAPRYPADVYAVLGSLAVLSERLPQALRQLGRFLGDEVEHGRVTAVEGQPFAGDPVAAVASATQWLWRASHAAVSLRDALASAQQATAGLARVAHDEDEDGTP